MEKTLVLLAIAAPLALGACASTMRTASAAGPEQRIHDFRRAAAEADYTRNRMSQEAAEQNRLERQMENRPRTRTCTVTASGQEVCTDNWPPSQLDFTRETERPRIAGPFFMSPQTGAES